MARIDALAAPHLPGAGGAPLARKPGELAVVWKAVRMVEAGQLLNERSSRERPKVNPQFVKLAGDFKNFLQYGQSSLTPYEANMLMVGLYHPGFQRQATSLNAPFTSGDRVQVTFSINGQHTQTHGIVADGGKSVLTVQGDDILSLPIKDWFRHGSLDGPVSVTKLSPAFIDARSVDGGLLQ